MSSNLDIAIGMYAQRIQPKNKGKLPIDGNFPDAKPERK